MKKKYTADEIINIIKKGWNSSSELEELKRFIDNADMDEEELKELQYSGYLELVYEFSDD